METLRQLLQDNGRNPDEAEALASKYNYTPDAVTESDAQLIMQEELQAQSAMTVSNGKSAPPATKRGGGGRRKKTTDIDPTQAIIKAAKGVESELSAYERSLLENKPLYVEQRSDRIVNEILSTSAEVTHAVAKKLNEAEADPDSFRTTGGATGNILFPLIEPDEAA